MGLVAIESGTAEAIAAPASPVGLGLGGLFAATALIAALVYLDALDAEHSRVARRRRALLTAVGPLLVTFACIVLYQILVTL